MNENIFKGRFIARLKKAFPDIIVIRGDPSRIQGLPDHIFLYHETWFALEFKRGHDAKHRPNQDYWVDRLNHLSFARFVYPENEEEVFDDISRALSICRETRIFERQ